MTSVTAWFGQNYEWLFGGIGVAVLAGIIKLLYRDSASQQQSLGERSIGIQTGGTSEIHIAQGTSDNDKRSEAN